MYNKDDGNLNKLKKNLKENSRSFIFILGAGMSRAAGLLAARGMLWCA